MRLRLFNALIEFRPLYFYIFLHSLFVTYSAQSGEIIHTRDIVISAQATPASGINAETLVSLDHISEWREDEEQLTWRFEFSTSPNEAAIAETLPTNNDSGTALDGNGNPRIQLSEFFYTHETDTVRKDIGLMEISTLVDRSQYANEENDQFLTPWLVNNASIEFPDYALGMRYEQKLNATQRVVALISSSHGISDNDSASYGDLIDVTQDGKGIFSALEWHYHTNAWNIQAGTWFANASITFDDNNDDDGIERRTKRYGVYLSADQHLDRWGINYRLGFANRRYAQQPFFASIAAQYTQNERAQLGIGVATSTSNNQWEESTYNSTGSASTTSQLIFEGYLRYAFNQHQQLTTALIFYNNGEKIDGTHTNKFLVLSLRYYLTF